MYALQLLSMIGFAFLFSLLTLYCSTRLGFTGDRTYAVVAAFNALAFAMSVPGGYIAQRFFGYRLGTWIPTVLCIIGLGFVALNSVTSLYIGLGIYTFGTSMQLPCLYVLLGRLYHKQHKESTREHGFMMAYISMNVGSVFTMGFSGTISTNFGYGTAFTIGAIAYTLVLIVFGFFQHYYRDAKEDATFDRGTISIGLLWTLAGVVATGGLIYFASINNAMMLILGVVSAIWLIKIALGYTHTARAKLLVFLLLNIISVIFWCLYTLGPEALIIFTKYNIDRHIFGMQIPAANFTSLNPFFIITCGPLISLLWRRLEKRGIKISIATKFSIGTVLMGVGYLVMVGSIHLADFVGMIGIGWLVLSYFFQTVGELLIGPVGYAMVGKLVPSEHEGLMMGFWQLSSGVAGALSAYFADMTNIPGDKHIISATNPVFAHMFLLVGLITVIVGGLALIATPWLNKAMR